MATHPPETDKGDAETPGRADRVGKMKGSESEEAQTRGGGGGEADVSPSLEHCEPSVEGGSQAS